MSSYSFSDQDLERERSLNRYREEMLRQEAERRAEEARREMGQPASDFVKEAERQLTRTIRSAIQSDPVAQEARTAYLTVGTIVNVASFVALSVGSLAAETAYTRSVMSSQDDYKDMYKDALNQRQDELAREDRTLAAYQQRVEETRDQLAKNDPEYAQEYRRTTDEAKERVREAEQTYKTESNDIRAQQRQADTTYRETTQQCQTRLQESQQIFSNQTAASQARTDSMISNANDVFERERTRIEKEYPAGKERQEALSAAATARDTKIENARELHEMNVAGYRDEMQTRNAPIQREMDQASSRHQITTNQLTERQTAADTRRSDVITRERSNIETATQKYDALAAAAKKEYNGAQAELAKYNDRLRESAANSLIMSNTRGFANVGHGADRLVDAITSSHRSLGNELAAHLGTERERELIVKYNTDRQAEKAAKENGTKYTSTMTNKEMEQINAISRKYAGNLSSESGVEKSLSALKKAEKDLFVERESLGKSITSIKNQINGVNAELKNQTAALRQLKADQEALKKGVDVNGKRLSPEERQKIQERINTNGPAIAKRLDELKKDKQGLTSALSKTEGRLAKNNQLANSIGVQKKFLNKHGKTISDTILNRTHLVPKIWNPLNIGMLNQANKFLGKLDKNISPVRATSKKAAKLQKKATNTLFKSVSTLKREFDRSAHKGNDLHKEIMSLTRGAARIAGKYNQALALAQFTGKVALKVLKVPGGMFRTIGKGTFRVLGKSAFLQRIGNSKFVQGMGKFVGKGGKIIGGTGKLLGKGAGMILKAPGVILMAPMKLQQLPQTIAKAALNGTIRTTRKVVGKTVGGTARLVGKGVRYAGKTVGKGLKAGFKATVGKSKWYNKVSNRFKQLKGAVGAVFKKIASPFTLAKAWIAKIWAIITSAISSLLSAISGFLLEVLGYVALGALILLLVLLAGSAIAAILDVILAWFADITADGKMSIKNRTIDILNYAALYREGELKIYYRFLDAEGMIPSSNPLYTDGFSYEAMEAEALSGESFGEQTKIIGSGESAITKTFMNFSMFGTVDLIDRDNTASHDLFNKIYKKFNNIGNGNFWNSDMTVTTVVVKNSGDVVRQTYTHYIDWFDNSSIWGFYEKEPYELPDYVDTTNYRDNEEALYRYLNNDDSLTAAFKARLEKYENVKVTYKTATGDDAIGYEISNTKDIMALFDTVFQDDVEGTSYCEMLMYLAGPTALKKGTSQSGTLWKCDHCYNNGEYGSYKVDECDTYKSFFWASHRLEYKEGTKPEDVKFHTTNPTENTIATRENTTAYVLDEWTRDDTVPTVCNNYKIMTVSYDHVENTDLHTKANINLWAPTTPQLNWTWLRDDIISVNNYRTDPEVSPGGQEGEITAMKLYYEHDSWTYYSFNNRTGKYSTQQDYYAYHICDNEIEDTTVTSWHTTINNNGGNAESIHFHKYIEYSRKHQYYVTDGDGNLFGLVDLEKYPKLLEAITRIKYQAKDGLVDQRINRGKQSDGYPVTLNYFYISWDEISGHYTFRVYGKSEITEQSTKQAVKNSLKPLTTSPISVYYNYNPRNPIDVETDSYGPATRADLDVDYCKGKNYAGHVAETITPYTIEYHICGGHVNLEATVRVATMDDEDYFWYLARHIYPLPEGEDIDSFFGIYQGDTEINGVEVDTSGWGNEDIPAFKPYRDWTKDKNITMAKAKRQANLHYDYGNEDPSDDHIDLEYRGSSSTFPSVLENEGNFLFGFTAFSNRACFTHGFKSGIQADIECLIRKKGQSGLFKGIVTHEIDANGNAAPKIEWE